MRNPNLAPPTFGGGRMHTIAEVKLRLATPMLGGGTSAGRVDRTYPIRASAIRGLLRHWWRATTGVTLDSPRAMAIREAEIFGSSAGEGAPGLVKVTVTGYAQASPVLLRDAQDDIPAYARGILIEPATMPDAERNQIVPAGYSFVLSIAARSTDHALEIELSAAIEAWLRYGGVGARSRRGFGALELVDGSFGALAKVIVGKDGFPLVPGFTSLQTARVLQRPKPEAANAAWGQAVGMLSRFRKAEHPELGEPSRVGRVEGGRMGKTPWPEAGSIRADGELKLPRAGLGIPMPIKSLVRGDFGEFEVFGYGESDRMASPVLCRPLAVDGKWRAGVILLGHEPIDASLVRAGAIRGRPSNRRVNTSAAGHPSTLKGRGQDEVSFTQPHEDVVAAFGHYLKSTANWEEVPIA